jgi:hypothetical protein
MSSIYVCNLIEMPGARGGLGREPSDLAGRAERAAADPLGDRRPSPPSARDPRYQRAAGWPHPPGPRAHHRPDRVRPRLAARGTDPDPLRRRDQSLELVQPGATEMCPRERKAEADLLRSGPVSGFSRTKPGRVAGSATQSRPRARTSEPADHCIWPPRFIQAARPALRLAVQSQG